jgi:hypothetical protein
MIEQDKKELLGVLKEISNAMTRSDAERDFVKDAIKEAAEKFQMNKKILRKMAKVYHKNSFNDEVSEMEEFQQMYENIVMV